MELDILDGNPVGRRGVGVEDGLVAIVDRGHNFGADLPNEDKEALIEFIKTL